MPLIPRSLLLPRTRAFASSCFAPLLHLCTYPQSLRQVHARYVLHGLHQNPTLLSQLIDRYANLGHLASSLRVFDSVADPDIGLFNALIRILSAHGQPDNALVLFAQIFASFKYPDETSFLLVLRLCSKQSNLGDGISVHCPLVKLGFESHFSVSTSLVELYVKCGEMDDAQRVVDRMPERNVTVWNLLISGFCQTGHPLQSFWLLKEMRREGCMPDSVTLVALLRSSAELKWLDQGRSSHLLAVTGGLLGDLSVDTALLTMYSKMGCLEMARLVFEHMPQRDSAVWNLMITAYSRNGRPEKALELLSRMGKTGVRTDLFTAIAAISVASELRTLEQGKQIHAHVIRKGSDYQVSVHNSLIEMYAKCGRIEKARKIFNSLVDKTVVSWSSMIRAYVVHDHSSDALALYEAMKLEGMKLDTVTVINLLPACVQIGALKKVKDLHVYSVKHGLNFIPAMVTTLLVSYAKCGCIDIAQKLFDEEEKEAKDIISWNSMISAYAKHGNWCQCFELYSLLKNSHIMPDRVTFVGLLTACVNSGLVKEGWGCFREMMDVYGYQPEQEHYACMVDLLGRQGQLDEAMTLIESMPFQPEVQVWGPLLSACKLHSQPALANVAAEKLMDMEPTNAGNYVLISNIYAAAGRWDGVAKLRGTLRDRGLKKTPGCSWLEINGCVHEFRVADRSHPKSEDIYATLKRLQLEIRMFKEHCLRQASCLYGLA